MTIIPITRNTHATGLVKKMLIEPPLNFKALLVSPSNIEPNTRPSTIGAVGNPPLINKYPANPIPKVNDTSK